MIRQAAFVLCSVIAVGQVQPEDPFEVATQAYFQARQKGQYDAAAALRERMNQALQAEAPDDPRFAGRAQNLAQYYDGDGMSAAGRAVLEGALARAAGANVPGSTRAALLVILASFWERDRNLLKSLTSLESAAAILEQTPAAEESGQLRDRVTGLAAAGQLRQAMLARPNVISANGSSRAWYGSIPGLFPGTPSRVSVYMQLADLYQRLGRKDQVAAVLEKMKALPKESNNWNLAQFYEQHGDLEQAADAYRKQIADSAADPGQITFPAERLASIYQQMQRPDDAVAVLREAIAAIENSGNAELAAHNGLREQLAMLLYRSGRADVADQAYPPPADSGAANAGLAINYANYLG